MRKCLKCGHVFIKGDGEFILRPITMPVCPSCKSIFTIRALPYSTPNPNCTVGNSTAKKPFSYKSFTYPRDFVPTDYFHDVFGIVSGTGGKEENIVIRTYAELPGYLRSLPMHHSQRELTSNEEYTDFSLRLRPSFDFILHRDQLEVLSPRTLRDEVAEIISKMKNHYEDSDTAKQ